MTESKSPKTPESLKPGNNATDGGQLKKLKLPVVNKSGSESSRKMPPFLKADKSSKSEAVKADEKSAKKAEEKGAENVKTSGNKGVEEKSVKTATKATDSESGGMDALNTITDVNKPSVSSDGTMPVPP